MKKETKSLTLVISQPMFFPWVGTFEKIMLADKFLYDDDVQYPKGTFTNRVQIKTPAGLKWLTVPLKNFPHQTHTREIQIDNIQNWKHNHLARFSQNYHSAPYHGDALRIMESVYSCGFDLIIDLAAESIKSVCSYLGIHPRLGFARTSEYGIKARKSKRIHDLAVKLKATQYVCGAGNQKVEDRYLDHELLESSGISVEYITYVKQPYPQLFGDFSPYVSILDLIANVGPSSTEYLNPNSEYWRTLL
jgi:hypothetical protein